MCIRDRCDLRCSRAGWGPPPDAADLRTEGPSRPRSYPGGKQALQRQGHRTVAAYRRLDLRGAQPGGGKACDLSLIHIFLYFQFVFAAITPLLFIGSVLGRIKFLAWCILCPAWSTFVYGVDAFMLWGGGYFAQEGALDFSGGFVIHMSAGVSGFVAAWVLGPRLARDREHFVPNNLLIAGVGAGILWLGWNGFNGGDPYYAGIDMSAAVVNTNIATAVGVLAWMGMDGLFSRAKKPTFLGGINGMICGLVGITPCAGWVNGWGAILVGLIDTVIVWCAWNFLVKVKPFSKVDDALGVIYTHRCV